MALLAVSMTEKANDAPMTSDEADGQSDPERESRPDARQQQEQRRVDDVELLLDRQGPVVLQRGGGLLRAQVVGPDGAEMEVGQEDRGPAPVGGGPAPRPDAQEEVRQDRR